MKIEVTGTVSVTSVLSSRDQQSSHAEHEWVASCSINSCCQDSQVTYIKNILSNWFKVWPPNLLVSRPLFVPISQWLWHRMRSCDCHRSMSKNQQYCHCSIFHFVFEANAAQQGKQILAGKPGRWWNGKQDDTEPLKLSNRLRDISINFTLQGREEAAMSATGETG